MWLELIRRKAEIALAGAPMAEIFWAMLSIGSFMTLLCSLAC